MNNRLFYKNWKKVGAHSRVYMKHLITIRDDESKIAGRLKLYVCPMSIEDWCIHMQHRGYIEPMTRDNLFLFSCARFVCSLEKEENFSGHCSWLWSVDFFKLWFHMLKSGRHLVPRSRTELNKNTKEFLLLSRSCVTNDVKNYGAKKSRASFSIDRLSGL